MRNVIRFKGRLYSRLEEGAHSITGEVVEVSAMSCPNCERLREELIENVKNMKSQFDGSGLIREGHSIACDSFIRVIDALALPSEEKKCLCKSDNFFELNPKCPLLENHLKPSESGGKKCEHDQGFYYWTATKKGQTINVSKSVCLECPYCASDTVKKEPEQATKELWNCLGRIINRCHSKSFSSIEDDAERTLRETGFYSERSTAPKECSHSYRGNDYLCIKCGEYFPEHSGPKDFGREEDLEVLEKCAFYLKHAYEWLLKSRCAINGVTMSLIKESVDALEALEKRRGSDK